MNDAVQLLDHVAAIWESRKKNFPTTEENFNILSVLNMETDEVNTHCRFLYELLSPNGSHGMKDLFLQAFFEMVLNKTYCKGISVYREYTIPKQTDDDYGRIDILLQGKEVCYPIEVKIYARDQWKQIDRYSRFAASKAKEYQVYYLTLDGHEPSEDSKRGSGVTPISFSSEIKNWLMQCGEIAWNAPGVAEVIRQYILLIDKLTGKYMEEALMSQIKDAIKDSQIKFESARAISSAVISLQQEMLEQVFQEIENHMAEMKDPLEKMVSCYTGSFPGAGYRLKDYDKWIITLHFESSRDGFYYGVTLLDRKTKTACTFPEDLSRLESAFPNQNWREQLYNMASTPVKDRWWIWKKYLPKGDPKELNLKTADGRRYTELFDPEKHEQLMGEIFEQIDEHIETIRETGCYD